MLELFFFVGKRTASSFVSPEMCSRVFHHRVTFIFLPSLAQHVGIYSSHGRAQNLIECQEERE